MDNPWDPLRWGKTRGPSKKLSLTANARSIRGLREWAKSAAGILYIVMARDRPSVSLSPNKRATTSLNRGGAMESGQALTLNAKMISAAHMVAAVRLHAKRKIALT